MKTLLLVLLLMVSVTGGFAQPLDTSVVVAGNSILYEKLYLHIDRELYSPGDEVWFKSYLVSGIDYGLIQGYKNIYVQLVAEDGSLADQKLLLSKDGIARGDFLLPDSIPEGNYTVRAYTRYMQNFSEESYFHKRIVIAGAKSSLELDKSFREGKPSEIDVDFLPEGGSFIVNAINYIGFKAIDEKGKGVPVKGKIVDETGNEVVSFSTSYKGMGKFIMMPQEGKTYFAIIDEFPDYRHQLDAAQEQGVCLNYKPEGTYLVFTLSRNLKINVPESYLLVASHKGTELFSSNITMTEFQQAIKLYKGLFPLGISQISVYNRTGELLAERLVFVRNAMDPKIQIIPDKPEYRTREKVEINLQALLSETDSVISTVSAAVVNEDYFSASGNNINIESYLLLDSELKGSVESPATYFTDEPGNSADQKLDYLMMVNGWRSYYWNELVKYSGTELPGWADYGLTFEGKVTRTWGGKPVDFGKVVLGPYSGSFLFEETTTDQNGNFRFDKLYLKDSALVMINAETNNNNKRTEISIEQPLSFDSLISARQINSVCSNIQGPMKFYRDIYYRQMAQQEYEKELGSILLDEVKIDGKRISRTDGHFRLYGEPDYSYSITTDDWSFASISDYLETKVPGLVVNGDDISIRSGSGNPLLLVDGLEVTWDYIKYIHLGDVDKIEILKSPGLLATYGSRGGNGVIAVLTKMGGGELSNEFIRNIPGRITPRVKGFQQPRQFYSPKYTPDNINDPKPDSRPTLYWNSDVSFTGSEASVEFFTSDNLARYYVLVEGISRKGTIICGAGVITVSVAR